jgi:hypothetical protein
MEKPPGQGAQCLYSRPQNFVAALLNAGLVAPALIAERLPAVPDARKPAAERAREWIHLWQ